eukprot:CAMPEP_0178390576 /NCGR_PEP_ID=MMETSP0689_2-20121128/10718_1 /TAXON_ID=160604 /ORGANISM="Amphidinium massartii, Strain CS-259" /LENGTH=34 /DNA_ID= /DNA_START= /DNA_END= /DNA_ORIENTATION=
MAAKSQEGPECPNCASGVADKSHALVQTSPSSSA